MATAGYGITKDATPLEVEAERNLANRENPLSQQIKRDQVERVTYRERSIEIPTIDHKAMGRPTDPQFERNKSSVMSRIRAIGVSKAVVVNFLPWMLRTDSLLGPSRAAKIPPPQDKEPYGIWLFDEVFIEPGRRGSESPLLATEWHPIQMADEFAAMNPLGVMAFKGIPSDLTDPNWLAQESIEARYHGKTNGQVLEETRAASVAAMHERLRHGNEADRQKRDPTLPQKASARRLYHLGYIKEMPSWVERQRDVNQKIPICPKCQKPSETGASQCTSPNCGFIIDPRKAYEINAISEDDPSLERLTRAEVKEMGISKYVAETVDEKAKRLELGAPKPLSEAAQALKDAQDEYDDSRQQRLAKETGAALAGGMAKANKADKPEKG